MPEQVAQVVADQGAPEASKEQIQDAASTNDEEQLTLESTVWDMGVIIQLRNPDGSLLIPISGILESILLVAINTAIQLTFSYWAVSTYSDAGNKPFPEDSRGGILYWRLSEGQLWTNIDKRNMLTAANRVCSGSITNFLSDAGSDIDDYLDPSVPGEMIQTLAILIWVLLIMAELARTLAVCSSVALLPTAQDGQGNVSEEPDGTIAVKRMRVWQKVGAACLVFIPRLLISVVLAVSGIFFLVATYKVEDIILNACALEIVQNVDEILYEALSSQTVSEVVANIKIRSRKPAKLKSMYSWGVFWYLRFFLIIGTMAYSYSLVVETKDAISIAYSNLCGEDLSFAYIDHPISGTPVFTSFDTESIQSQRLEELQCFHRAVYHMKQIRAGFNAADDFSTALILNQSSDCWADDYSCPELSLAEFRELSSLSGLQVRQDLKYCVDQDAAFYFIKMNCTAEGGVAGRLLSELSSCSDTKSLFQDGGQCTMNTGDKTAFSPEWCTTIQNVCARSGGLCADQPDSTTSSIPGSSSGPDQLRLLSDRHPVDDTSLQSLEDENVDLTNRVDELAEQVEQLRRLLSSLEPDHKD
mmetsp:Transcript_11218/g.25177  ORF Transcript_11218/g.25177 Transcript_11218/m.25177 type:complete len:586 (-) Transcript_11218:52-1809(-)